MNMIEKATRALALQRYDDEDGLLFVPVPEDYPNREAAQAYIDERRRTLYSEVRAVMRAMLDPTPEMLLGTSAATDVYVKMLMAALMEDDPS